MAITESYVRTLLAAQVHLTTGTPELRSFWDAITAESMDEAEAWINNTLLGMGYLQETIDDWVMFDHYQLRLALFWCGVYGSAQLSDVDALRLKLLDPRAEVLSLTSLGGILPDNPVDDLVQGGRMERDDDLFAVPAVNAGGSLSSDVFRTTGRVWNYSR